MKTNNNNIKHSSQLETPINRNQTKLIPDYTLLKNRIMYQFNTLLSSIQTCFKACSAVAFQGLTLVIGLLISSVSRLSLFVASVTRKESDYMSFSNMLFFYTGRLVSALVILNASFRRVFITGIIASAVVLFFQQKQLLSF
jgi:hypothetical protein